MNAHEACLRARQAWERTQPQYVIPGVLEEVDAGGADGDSAAASASSSAPEVAAPISPDGHPGALSPSTSALAAMRATGALDTSTKEQSVEPAEIDRMVEQLKEMCDPRGHDLVDAIGELAREASQVVKVARGPGIRLLDGEPHYSADWLSKDEEVIKLWPATTLINQ